MMSTVVIGMSGGVDSSVAAYLLQQQGFKVIGLFMKNWEEDDDTGCAAEEDFADVSAVCEQLSIPYYSVNFAKQYWERVFERCLRDYRKGLTPNPDILCNSEIKFRLLLERAQELGGDYLATGHYCRLEGGSLLRGVDPQKDQSYFLHAVPGSQMTKVLFPLGGMEKQEIRKIAHEQQLATASKRDSTGICFVGKQQKFRTFLQRFLPSKKGNFVTPEGEIVATHEGAHFYTIGQRRGLEIGGEGAAWYVADKCLEHNEVVVVQGEEHPALFSQRVVATTLSWIAGEPPEEGSQLSAQIRYRQEAAPCYIEEVGEQLVVHFDEPQRAVTPGQSLVLYDGENCLGGGVVVERS